MRPQLSFIPWHDATPNRCYTNHPLSVHVHEVEVLNFGYSMQRNPQVVE
jgi:hypothetical protein